jgi:DNA-binding NtrC family response regulator
MATRLLESPIAEEADRMPDDRPNGRDASRASLAAAGWGATMEEADRVAGVEAPRAAVGGRLRRTMYSILVVDDDRSVHSVVERAFRDSEIAVHAADNGRKALELVRQKPDVVLLDVMLADDSGLDLLERIRTIDPKLPVMFITASGTSDTAIEAMKAGAFEYLLKPLDLGKLRELVARALEIRRLMQVRVELPPTEPSEARDEMVGRCAAMQEVYKAIGRVADQDVTVLIRGESGTGKELVARAIYQHSRRAGECFLAVNCAAIPDTLLESELFGHEKGSFTSADRRRIGKFEHCNGGTIFLDEIGDMSPLLQSKVLRVLQEQRFERVGGTELIETDVRLVAATHRDLEKMVADGKFRDDLYYRLNGFTIELPPLRERGGDVLLLVEHCLRLGRQQLGKEVTAIAPEALDLLTRYSWPGNVRELHSVIRQAMLNTVGPMILPEFLPEAVREHGRPKAQAAAGPPAPDIPAYLEQRLREQSQLVELLERHVITRVLDEAGGNQSRAAKLLGITRGSLRNKLRDLGITLAHTVSVEDENQPDRDGAAV